MTQSLDRIWSTVEQHEGPPWYYLLELLKYSWPWLIFWPTGVGVLGRSRHQIGSKLLLVWTGGYMLAISVMGTKLPWYLFPLYPAIALTCGVALAAAWNMHQHWHRRALSIQRLPKAWGILLAVFSVAGAAGTVYASPWGGEPSWALALTFLSIMTVAGLAVWFVFRQQVAFVPVLLVGFYVALLCLMTSDHWVWELGEDFSVLPVATLVQQNTPSVRPCTRPIPMSARLLNFYSDRHIIARPPTELQALWQAEQPVYLLVQDRVPYQTPQGNLTDFGSADGWHLILKQSALSTPREPKKSSLV